MTLVTLHYLTYSTYFGFQTLCRYCFFFYINSTKLQRTEQLVTNGDFTDLAILWKLSSKSWEMMGGKKNKQKKLVWYENQQPTGGWICWGLLRQSAYSVCTAGVNLISQTKSERWWWWFKRHPSLESRRPLRRCSGVAYTWTLHSPLLDFKVVNVPVGRPSQYQDKRVPDRWGWSSPPPVHHQEVPAVVCLWSDQSLFLSCSSATSSICGPGKAWWYRCLWLAATLYSL